jgi:tetratricopeptide (TPR) repeat protein
MLRRFILAALLALLLSGPPAARAAEISQQQQYRACVALVYRQADEALESAKAWEAVGGGVYARHCQALALFEKGELTQAGERLEALVSELPPDGVVGAADVLAQAGNVWLLAGELARAGAALDRAIALKPDDEALRVDKARVLAAGGDYLGALAALDRALQLAPDDDDAQAFRASALRHLGRLDEAFEAVERALRLNTDNASAWLERGLIHLARGNLSAARLDLSTTKLRFAGTPAAETAAAKLVELKKNGG